MDEYPPSSIMTPHGRYLCGMWGLPCFNALSPDQQKTIVERGNLPLGWRRDLSGDCHNPAEVEVSTIWDTHPGPRFYCTHCARDRIVDLERARRRAAHEAARTAPLRNVGIIGHTDVGKTDLARRVQDHAPGAPPREPDWP